MKKQAVLTMILMSLILGAFVPFFTPTAHAGTFGGEDAFNFSTTFSAASSDSFAISSSTTSAGHLIVVTSYCNFGSSNIAISNIGDSAGDSFGRAARKADPLKRFTTDVWFTQALSSSITSMTILYNASATACIIDGQGFATTSVNNFQFTVNNMQDYKFNAFPISQIAPVPFFADSLVITTGAMNVSTISGTQTVVNNNPSTFWQNANGNTLNLNGVKGFVNEGWYYTPVTDINVNGCTQANTAGCSPFGMTFQNTAVQASDNNLIIDFMAVVFGSSGITPPTLCAAQTIGAATGTASGTRALTSNITYYYVGTSPVQGGTLSNESLLIHDTTLTNGQTAVKITIGVYGIAGTSSNPLVGNTNAIAAGNPLVLVLISKTTVQLANGLGVTYVTFPVNDHVITSTTWAVAVSVSHTGVTVFKSTSAVTLDSDTPDGVIPNTMGTQTAEANNAYLYGILTCPPTATTTSVSFTFSCSNGNFQQACTSTVTSTSVVSTDIQSTITANLGTWGLAMLLFILPLGVFLMVKSINPEMGPEGALVGFGFGIALELFTGFLQPIYVMALGVQMLALIFARRG